VEDPVRQNRFLIKNAKICIVGSTVVMLLGIGTTLGWRSWSKHTENYKVFGTAMVDLPEDARLGCENGFGDSIPHECDFGDKSAGRTVILFGDSHIEQWLPALHEIADRKGWKIALFVKSSCPALAIPIWDPQSGKEDHSCSTWRESALQRITELKPSLVLLSNFSGYMEANQANTLVSLSAWRSGARATFAKLHGAGIPTAFLHDTPWARFEVTQCLSRDDWRGTHRCAPLQRSAALNEGIYNAVEEGANGMELPFIDLSNKICGPEICDLRKNGMIVYRDAGHLTGTFLRSLAPDLEQALLKSVPSLAGERD